MPYRIEVSDPPPGGPERLIDLDVLDLDMETDRETGRRRLTAIVPDRVSVERVAQALGLASLPMLPAVGRDDASVWVLKPRPVRAGRWTLLPVDRERAAGGDTHDSAASPAAPANGLAVHLADSQAFGTGLHPTTALCLELLDETLDLQPPAELLDVGIGSGVLALAALRTGVPAAVGLDIDPEALRAAAANARLNGVEDRLRLVPGGPDAVAGLWPLVLANVVAAPLVEMAPLLVRRLAGGGRMILSGIPDGLTADVERSYRRLGLRHCETRQRGGWTALRLAASW